MARSTTSATGSALIRLLRRAARPTSVALAIGQ
jgi:hypothetical protein